MTGVQTCALPIYLLINYPELVSPLKTAEPQFFQDCDTPEAYRDLQELFATLHQPAKSA